MSNQYAVVVAGGKGTRMNSELPKQFISIGGRPMLMHTLQAFYSYSPDLNIIVVLPEQEQDVWQKLCDKYDFTIPHRVVTGGNCRPYSVRNGLSCIAEKGGLVAIHDGARPLVSPTLIRRSFEIARVQGSAVASVALKDAIRELTDSGSSHRDREQYRLLQTPQTFRVELLQEAYRKVPNIETYPDDSSIAEAAGERVTLIDGDYFNIKVTTPEDLKIAEVFLQERLTAGNS